ncbi:histidine N-acetyltransferase-like isoform X2 [Pomacea canaliculata]|uniref:histidine N-acetyltransferase-like isoform X2 n=1 Tax=Pomacea canaliculata TaxID=400727 RepID=UPI000D72EA35|nr:histidine N-acetyltransferase-like isoform X2 [Pomacea canaliculata]
MEQMPSDEELCIASLADRQSVVAIADDVHSGTDYLPATYPSLVEGPGVRGYIYKKGGKAIAFMSTQLTDGGRTLLETAGRVVKEYRGRGVYGRLQRLVRDRHLGSPHLCYINLALNEISMAVYGQRLLKTYQQVAEKMEELFSI